MSFSKSQQGLFRLLVEDAWKAHCKANTMDPVNKELRNEWYRGELQNAVGKTSTVCCNSTTDFEAVMAHFEVLAGNGIAWQMKQFRGNAKRILHTIVEYANEYQIDEDYLRRIARQALQTNYLPELHTLRADQLITIRRAVIIYCRRQLNKDPF